MWKHLLKNLSKGRDKPIKKFFPKLSVEEKEMLELGKKWLSGIPGTNQVAQRVRKQRK